MNKRPLITFCLPMFHWEAGIEGYLRNLIELITKEKGIYSFELLVTHPISFPGLKTLTEQFTEIHPVLLEADTEADLLVNSIYQAQGEYVWVLDTALPLRAGAIGGVLNELLYRPHRCLTQDTFRQLKLMMLLSQKYINSAAYENFQEFFGHFSPEEHLEFLRRALRPLRTAGFFSSQIFYRDALPDQATIQKKGKFWHNSILFYLNKLQHLNLQIVIYPETVFVNGIENDAFIEYLLQPAFASAVNGFKTALESVTHALLPCEPVNHKNYQVFLRYLELESRARHLYDLILEIMEYFLHHASDFLKEHWAEFCYFLSCTESSSRYEKRLFSLQDRLFHPQPTSYGYRVHKQNPRPEKPKLSIILLDWSCRERFHTLDWLNQQTIPREDYELIWVELYHRVLPIALEKADVVITCEQEGIYHKHKGYNAGLLEARGDIITVCDSDAVFPPNFVQSVFDSFGLNHSPEPVPLVLMHHEGRTLHTYPDNLRNYEQIRSVTWEYLYPNAGACVSVRTRDALLYGGFDEHESLRGYICGPYDLAWRLVNAGIRQWWHDSVFIWHFAHPHSNQADNDQDWNEIVNTHIDYHATSSVVSFSKGRMQPLLENPEIFRRRMEMRKIGSNFERHYAIMDIQPEEDPLNQKMGDSSQCDHQQPLVSAIVTTYASERFMRGLLEDLEAQTLRDQLEIVIVDSNSPENEETIVREFQEKYQNIVYLKTNIRENSHVSLNRCIQMAKGKYITLACTDDRHLPYAFERMVAVLEARPDIALVYADIAITKNEQDVILNRPLAEAEICAYYIWPEFEPISFFKQCYAGPQPMWRRSLHDKYGYFDPEFWSAGDYEFWLRLVANGEKFLHIPDVLGLMLLSKNSNSNQNIQRSLEESERCRQRYWPQKWGKRPPPEAIYMYLPEQVAFKPPPVNITQDGPLVSIVFRHDQEEFGMTALKSITDQSYKHFEIVLVVYHEHLAWNINQADLNILFPEKQVYILNALGKTPREARNLALKACKGEYIAYLSSSDKWHTHHLHSLVQALQKGNSVVYSDAFRIQYKQQNFHLERLTREQNPPPAFSFENIWGPYFLPSVSFVHERSCLSALQLFPEDLEEENLKKWQEIQSMERLGLVNPSIKQQADWDLWFRMAEKFQIQHLDQITCEYYQPEQPISQSRPFDFLTRLHALDSQSYNLPHFPDLSVLILLENEQHEIDVILQALMEYLPENLEAEVILVDNASQDRSNEVLAELSGDIVSLRYLKKQNPKTAILQTQNLCRGKQMLLITQQSRFPFHTLPEILDSLQADELWLFEKAWTSSSLTLTQVLETQWPVAMYGERQYLQKNISGSLVTQVEALKKVS